MDYKRKDRMGELRRKSKYQRLSGPEQDELGLLLEEEDQDERDRRESDNHDQAREILTGLQFVKEHLPEEWADLIKDE